MSGTESTQSLRQEVRELTALLRSEASFADLRELLGRRNLAASEVVLAGLIESEDESSLGVFVLPDLRCILFETSPGGGLVRWDTMENAGALADSFRAVEVAVSMRRNNELV